jgi:hypothetical protein
MESQPLTPDAIRPAKGEHVVLSNYPKKRYTCACTFEHEWFAEVDEAPDVIARRNPETGKTEIFPRRCKGGRAWQLDRSYVDPSFTKPSKPKPISSRTFNNWDGYPKLEAPDA